LTTVLALAGIFEEVIDIVDSFLEENLIVLAVTFMYLLPLHLGVDGVDLLGVAVAVGSVLCPFSHQATFGGVIDPDGLPLVHELEQLLPVFTDLLVDLADVLHLSDENLLGGFVSHRMLGATLQHWKYYARSNKIIEN
jgi:hypothetical protein